MEEAPNKVITLSEWTTFSATQQRVILELMMLAIDRQGRAATEPLPLVMSVKTARDLAKDLLNAAVASEMGNAPTTSRQ